MAKKVAVVASELGCSVQNIYKLIRNHEVELEGHIIYEGTGKRKTMLLDDYAQDYLASNRVDDAKSGELLITSPEYVELQRKYMDLLQSHYELKVQMADMQGKLMEAQQAQFFLTAASEGKDRELAEKDKMLEEQGKQLESKDQEIAAKEKDLEATKCLIAGAQMDARNAQEHERTMVEERDAAVSALNEKNKEIADLKEKLEDEKDRPLTWLERLRGHK